jgi:starch-binding outer membrane protein, SusD/RagB family
LFKANGTTATWEDAAAAAHDVIALNQYSLNAAYAALFGASNSTLKEVIFKRRYGSINWLESNQFPVSFVGSNGFSLTPTQNFVDQFEVISANGSENFDWNNPAHAAKPYDNRDPRLSATVVYNGMKFKTSTIETFTGGNDGLPRQNATKTGYYLLKWVNPTVDLVNATTTNHAWCYFRYADILLSYAEAMYNAYGPESDPKNYGMTAIQAFNLVRKRAKVPELAANELNQARIERERTVELGFEDQRFWDVRRWGKGTEYFNAPVKRVVITKDASTLNYEVKELENRVYSEKMNWYPIPQSEITKTGWAQNPLW